MKHRYLIYLSILIFWGPSNSLSYLWGFLLLGTLLTIRLNLPNSAYTNNIIKVSLLFILTFIISFFINYYIVDSSINNLVWSIITYGSFVSFLIALLLLKITSRDIRKIFLFTIGVTVLEIIIGYAQMVNFSSSFDPFSTTSAAGDYFTGTFMRYGFAHLAALKISLVLIYAFVKWMDDKTLKGTIVLLFLILGWLLPSALYSVLLLAASFFIYFFIYEFLPRLRSLRLNNSILIVIIISIVGILLLSTTQKANVSYIFNQVEVLKKTIVEGDNSNSSAQKIHFFRTSLIQIPQNYPHALIAGVGPGNYSSRSAWIVSGMYLGNQPHYIPITPSKAAIEYSLPFFEDIVNNVRHGSGSIIHQPFSSWVSIFIELGIFGLILIIWLFRVIAKEGSIKDAQLISFSKGNTVAIIYVFLLMFVDNILEYPQFINQFLIFVVTINNVKHNGI